jgi:hypothetical protein
MAIMWAVAAMTACFSITLYVLQQNWGSFFIWWNVAILVLDIYMLVRAVKGLKYRRNVDRVVKKLIEESRSHA